MPISTPEIDIYADYPTIEPSLRLDFANSRALDPRITFTRASVATYVGKDGLIKYAKENEPRFDHDPATGESLGLLIEEQRTNLYVNNHDPALGASGTATKTTVQIVLPSGETGPALETDASGFAQNYRNQTAGSNTAPGYLTFYAKKKTSGSTGTLTITLEGGSTGRSFANIGINSDTWTKITHTHDWSLSNSTLRRFDAYLPTANTSDSDTSFYLAFIQFEDGNFPTSYIPTSGAQATRSTDVARILGESFKSFHNYTEHSLLVDYVLDKNAQLKSPLGTNQVRFCDAGGGGTNGGNGYSLRVVTNPTSPQIDAHGNYDFLTHFDSAGFNLSDGVNEYKVAMGFALNDQSFVSGSIVQIDTNVPLPNTQTVSIERLVIGEIPTKVHYKKIVYYSKRLANTQLQTLTQ